MVEDTDIERASIVTLLNHKDIELCAVATGGEDGLTKIWALPAIPPKAFAHPDAVLLFAPSPDGNRVMTVSALRLSDMSRPYWPRIHARVKWNSSARAGSTNGPR